MSTSHGPLAHQFDDLAQQKEAVTLGMWAFLATEVMFFGGAFAAYAVCRDAYPEAFAAASNQENWWIGALNTGVLLCSSLTMALAVWRAQYGDNRGVIRFVGLTALAATIFLGVKAYEYTHLIVHDHAPFLSSFQFDPPQFADGARLFLSFYFFVTGLHATHMVVGLGLMTWLVLKARRGEFTPANYNPVEVIGLYWHFVDIVWIFAYPLFYLVDRTAAAAGH